MTKFHIDNKRWLLRYRPLWMDSSLRHRVNYICIPFRNLSDLKKFFTPFENESNFIPPEFFSNYVLSTNLRIELRDITSRVALSRHFFIDVDPRTMLNAFSRNVSLDRHLCNLSCGYPLHYRKISFYALLNYRIAQLCFSYASKKKKKKREKEKRKRIYLYQFAMEYLFPND